MHLSIAADIFDINWFDNNAVDINEEESIDQTQGIHNMDKRSGAIVSLVNNEQAAHVHSNTVAEEAMIKLFDNLIKHEVDLADIESDENVKNVVQLLDTKLEDMSKTNRTSKLRHVAMLCSNWSYYLYKIMAYLFVKDGKSETLMYISQRV